MPQASDLTVVVSDIAIFICAQTARICHQYSVKEFSHSLEYIWFNDPWQHTKHWPNRRPKIIRNIGHSIYSCFSLFIGIAIQAKRNYCQNVYFTLCLRKCLNRFSSVSQSSCYLFWLFVSAMTALKRVSGIKKKKMDTMSWSKFSSCKNMRNFFTSVYQEEKVPAWAKNGSYLQGWKDQAIVTRNAQSSWWKTSLPRERGKQCNKTDPVRW